MPLSVLLVGSGGVGKSYLAATSPGPILVADLEGGSHKLPRPTTHWTAEDIAAGKFPSGLTPDSIVVAGTETFNQFLTLVTALHSPASPFRSFWVDSATVLSQLGEVEIARKKTNTQQGFGELLNLLRPAFTGLKQLTVRPDNSLEVLGFTAWQRDDKAAPSMQGSIVSWFNHTVDVVGYVSIDVIDGKLGQRMRIFPAPNGADPKAKGTGAMYHKYTDGVVTNPNFSDLNQETSN